MSGEAQRTGWHDGWYGGANRSFTTLLAEHGCDHRFGPPLLARLREGATIVEIENLVTRLAAELGVPTARDVRHQLAVRLAVWWDTHPPFDDPAA